MLGPHNPLHAARRSQLHASSAPLAHPPAQLVAQEEDTRDLVRGHRGAVAAGVRGAVSAECYRECMVFCADWEGRWVILRRRECWGMGIKANLLGQS